MSWNLVPGVVIALLLIPSAVDVVNTWRVARGDSTRRSRLFKGRLTPEMIHSDRAWQQANRAMLPGTVAQFFLIVLLLVLGSVLNIDWSLPTILLILVGVSIWNRVVGDRAAERAWTR